MKKFSSFLNEASKSFAAQEAERLQLTHVGYGKYADVRGNVTHMSKAGKLVKLSPQEQGGGQQGGSEEEGGSEKPLQPVCRDPARFPMPAERFRDGASPQR